MSFATLAARYGFHRGDFTKLARMFDPAGDVFTDEELELHEALLYGPADPADLATGSREQPALHSLAPGRSAGSAGPRVSSGKRGRQ